MNPSQLATVESPVGLPEDQKDLSFSEIEKVHSPGQQTAAEVDVVAERKLLDFLFMPSLMLLYLFSCLDRNSLGNVKLLGMVGPHGLPADPHGSAYSLLVAVFFVGYASLVIPFGILAKRYEVPYLQVSLAAVVWGVASTASGAVHSWAAATGTRFLMAVGEAAFQPVVPLLLSKWYSHEEKGSRFVWFYAANAVSGVMNGLIGYGLNFSHSSVAPWRLLFIIDGTPTIVLGLWAYWTLPGEMGKTRRLTPAERELAIARLARRETTEEPTLPWKQMVSILWSWPLMLPAISNMCAVLVLYVINIFLPVLIAESGHSGATAQLMTLPAYGSALFTMLACGYLSDKTGRRAPFLIFGFVLMVIGTVIIAAIPLARTVAQRNARYVGLCLMTNGGLVVVPLKLCVLICFHHFKHVLTAGLWITENAGNHARRAVAVPLVLALGQAISTAAGYMFPSKDSPAYRSGTFACLGVAIVGLCSTIAYLFLCIHVNRRRDRNEGKPEPGFVPDTAHHADKAKGFRYKW